MSPFRIFHITFYWLWIWAHLHFKCLSLAGLRQAEWNAIAVTPGGGSGVDRKWVHRIQELTGNGAGIHSSLGSCAGAKKQRRKMGRKKACFKTATTAWFVLLEVSGGQVHKGTWMKRTQTAEHPGGWQQVPPHSLHFNHPLASALGCEHLEGRAVSSHHGALQTVLTLCGLWVVWEGLHRSVKPTMGCLVSHVQPCFHSRPQEDWPRQGQGPPGTNTFQTCELKKETGLCNQVPTLEVWFALGIIKQNAGLEPEPGA